jgi:hypothetical protein
LQSSPFPVDTRDNTTDVETTRFWFSTTAKSFEMFHSNAVEMRKTWRQKVGAFFPLDTCHPPHHPCGVCILCVSMSVFRWYLCILWCILLSLFVYWLYSWRVFVQQDLKRLSFIYLQLLKTKPLLTKSVTSLFLFFSSDFFAQCMTERTMSWKRMCRFALWGIYDIFDSAYMWNNLALFSPWLSL